MTRQPGKGDGPDGAPVQRRPDGEVVEQASGVPVSVFRACDRIVEAKLIGDGLHLLRHMNIDDSFLVNAPPPEVADNSVDPGHVRDMLSWLEQDQPEGHPDLLEDLPLERLWILLDISVIGSGLARQRATFELRTTMQDLRACDGMDTAQLEELSQMLTCDEFRALPMLCQTLRLATERALRQLPPDRVSTERPR